MKRAKIFAAVIYGMLAIGTIAFVHYPELEAREMHAKIGTEQARETALRAVPGTVNESDLETEHCGNISQISQHQVCAGPLWRSASGTLRQASDSRPRKLGAKSQ